MSKTAIGVEFTVNDLNANYEVVGTSDNYSFRYELGRGSSLVDEEGDNTFKSVPLQGNYGVFDVRIFAVSDIGIRSEFVQDRIEIFPNFLENTFTFSDINIDNLPNDSSIGKEIIKEPLTQGDSLYIKSEYVGRSADISWSLIAPYGHAKEGQVLSSELLGDTFFNKFSLSFKTGENPEVIDNSILSESEALREILLSQDVLGSLNNYRDFSINLNENFFNELDIDRNLTLEIVAHDKFNRTCTGVMTGINYPSNIDNFLYNMEGGKFNASYICADTDFLNLNCQGFYIQQDYEIYSSNSVVDNVNYYTSIRDAEEYSQLSTTQYDIGDKVLFEDGKVYEAKKNHQNDPSNTSPPSTEYWRDLGVPPIFDSFGKAGSKEDFSNQQKFGFDYYYSFAAVDEYGIQEYFNLTEEGLEQGGVLKKIATSIKLENIRFNEREDDLIFNWDVVDGVGNLVDLNQYKFLFKQDVVPGIVGISGSLFDPHTNEFLTGVTEGNDTLSSNVDDLGNRPLVGNIHNAKVFYNFEYTRELNNQIHGDRYLPESGKRSVGLELGIINNLGEVIQKERIIGDNPPPVIKAQGFTADSRDQVTKVKFNFNYANGRGEKTSEVVLYRSDKQNFSILDSNQKPIRGQDPFVKSVLGAGDLSFGDNINQIIDDNPEVGEEITGYYYKILPFDDFGSGQLFECTNNQGNLEKVWVLPKNYYSRNPNSYPGPALNITTDEIPGPVEGLEGNTSFENYFLNWSQPGSQIKDNGLINSKPNDIDYYEVWQSTGLSDKFLEFSDGKFLSQHQNSTGYRRIEGVQYTIGEIPKEFNDFAGDIVNATNIFNIDASAPSVQASQKGLANDRRYFWVRPVDFAGNKGPFTGSSNSSSDNLEGLELTLGQVKTTDISDFEQNITTAFPNTLSLVPNNPFKGNTSEGSVEWVRHFVYYQGTGYVIEAGKTEDPFIYWSATGRIPTHDKNIVQLTSQQKEELGLVGEGGGNELLTSEISNPLRNIVYSGGYDTSSYHPAGEGTSIGVDEAKINLLGETDDFIIARNAGGIPSPMWHSFSNASIGSAHIQNAAITNAKIHNLTADKLRSEVIYGQDLQIGGNNLSGQIRSAGFGGLDSKDSNGTPQQGFAVSGDGTFVFQTPDGKLFFDGDSLTLFGKLKQFDGAEYTFLDMSAEPKSFMYVEQSDGTYLPARQEDKCVFTATYQNSTMGPHDVLFRLSSPDGYEFFSYDQFKNSRNGDLYEISGFKYDASLFSDGSDGALRARLAKAELSVTGFEKMIRFNDESSSSILPQYSSVIINVSGAKTSMERSLAVDFVADGASAVYVDLDVENQIYNYDFDGFFDEDKNESNDLKLSAGAFNTFGNVRFDFYTGKSLKPSDLVLLENNENNWSINGALGTASLIDKYGDHIPRMSMTPFTCKVSAIHENVDLGNGPTDLFLASDFVTVYGSQPGNDSYTVLLENENHTYVADEYGQVTTSLLAEGKTAIIFRRGHKYYNFDSSNPYESDSYSVGTIAHNLKDFTLGTNYRINAITRTIDGEQVKLAELEILNLPERLIDSNDNIVSEAVLDLPIFDNKYVDNSANDEFPPVRFDKKYTFTKSREGKKSRGIELSVTDQTIQYDTVGNVRAPTSIDVEVEGFNFHNNNPEFIFYKYSNTNNEWQILHPPLGTKPVPNDIENPPASYKTTDKKITLAIGSGSGKIAGTYESNDLPIKIKCRSWDGSNNESSSDFEFVAEDRTTIFGLKEGSNALTVIMSQEFSNVPVTLGANNQENLNFDNTLNTISVFEGATSFSYQNVKANLAPKQFHIETTLSGVTLDSSTTKPSFKVASWTSSSNIAHIDYEITVKDQDGQSKTFTKRQSLSKNKEGSPARAVDLTASPVQAVSYNEDDLTKITSGNITISAAPRNDLGGNKFYKYSKSGVGTLKRIGGGSYSEGSYIKDLNQIVYEPPSDIKGTSESLLATITCSFSETGSANSELASDQISIFALRAGSNATTIVLSNEHHGLTYDLENDPSPTGSGTNIQVFLGSVALTPRKYGNAAGEVTSGSQLSDGEFFVQASPSSNITAGSQSISSKTLIFADASGFKSTDNGAFINYNITVKDFKGQVSASPVTKKQTFSVTFKGDKGDKGDRGSGPSYRGEWNSATNYKGAVGDNLNVDIVRYSGSDYIALRDNVNKRPDQNTSDWRSLGAQFSSVATKLLITESSIVKDIITLGEQSDYDNNGSAYIRTHNENFFMAGILNGDNKFALGESASDLITINHATISSAKNITSAQATITDLISTSITSPTINATNINASSSLNGGDITGTSLTVTGDVVAFYGSSSDKRLKDNIIEIKNPLSKILSIKGVEFEWNNNSKIYSGKDYGLIAQDVQKIAPHLVKQREDGYLGLKYDGVIPFLVGAIKEQQKTIESLEERISKLENQTQ
jgi:hypothetical protein